MPTLHEAEEHIYTGITSGLENKPGPAYKWNQTRKLYEYSNSLFPNKNYTKTFDPKSFMTRGDVIHFGSDDYRNNNKMIFDGEQLIHLHTEVDDYGSVPPIFVVGDKEGEFDIGDFEDIIDHNSIYWLSKEKLQEIELYIKNKNVFGKVIIRGKEWNIWFEVQIKETDMDTLKNYIKEFLNKLVINYDNISKRYSIHQESDNQLMIYL